METTGTDGIAVRLNGQDLVLAPGTTVADLLTRFGLDPAAIVVEMNGEILRRDQHPATDLTPGARVEIVHFVGGG